MRALYIPLCVLLTLLIAALWSSAYTQNLVSEWITQIEEISQPMENEYWYDTESRILHAHQSWSQHTPFFHLIFNHRDLDETEKYFAGALAACKDEDCVELRINLSQLIVQLTFLADIQEVSWSNIL